METSIINKNEQTSTVESPLDRIKSEKETPILTAIEEPYKPITYADETFVALASVLLFSGELGAKLEETSVWRANAWSSSVNSAQRKVTDVDSDVEEPNLINRDRLELLARRYELKKLPAEGQARLTMLTERIRNLIPRVTEEDFRVLEDMARTVRGIEERRIALLRRLGSSQD